MSWIAGRHLTWCERFAVNVIKCGPIPRHAAFIIDGNRRYAKTNNMEKKFAHNHGREKLQQLAHWCIELGISEATVYTFSIDNFKRTSEEVKAFMDLTRLQLHQMLKKKDEFLGDGIAIRFIGKLELLPKDIRESAAQIEFSTKNNTKLVLNLAYAYSSREDMTNAIRIAVGGVRSGALVTADIDEDLLSKCMYTCNSPDPDILIRTSGQTRFSDFLLWQCQKTRIFIEEVMWPEFTLWNLLKDIFLYQQSHVEPPANKLEEGCVLNNRKAQFLENLDKNRKENLLQLVYA